MQRCAGTEKTLSLELGGNAPFIGFDDADIEMAVKGPRRAAPSSSRPC
jgi:succinate-semialdehyde dehydrogenase/glutarate-semialdehyde dehydrogenase